MARAFSRRPTRSVDRNAASIAVRVGRRPDRPALERTRSNAGKPSDFKARGAHFREEATSGRKIKRIVTADAYDCRGRNRQAGAKLSEHAAGDAIDLSAIEFVDGGPIRFVGKANDPALGATLNDSACARFSTVLGPGSDRLHEDHVHMDLAQRRSGYKICQWTLR